MKNNLPKIGIIGVGHLGRHHVKHLISHNDCQFMGLYDIDVERSKNVAEEYGARVFGSMGELIKTVTEFLL